MPKKTTLTQNGLMIPSPPRESLGFFMAFNSKDIQDLIITSKYMSTLVEHGAKTIGEEGGIP
jgi:hypothetical protein